MNRTFATGVVLMAGGVVGYVAGVVSPYPGRALSITGVMVGLTLVALGGGGWVGEQ